MMHKKLLTGFALVAFVFAAAACNGHVVENADGTITVIEPRGGKFSFSSRSDLNAVCRWFEYDRAVNSLNAAADLGDDLRQLYADGKSDVVKSTQLDHTRIMTITCTQQDAALPEQP